VAARANSPASGPSAGPLARASSPAQRPAAGTPARGAPMDGKTAGRGSVCWNLVHVTHLVNFKTCIIIVPYCQDKERLSCLNMRVSYHSKIDACERKGNC
jgi:hypothetical protein